MGLGRVPSECSRKDLRRADPNQLRSTALKTVCRTLSTFHVIV